LQEEGSPPYSKIHSQFSSGPPSPGVDNAGNTSTDVQLAAAESAGPRMEVTSTISNAGNVGIGTSFAQRGFERQWQKKYFG